MNEQSNAFISSSSQPVEDLGPGLKRQMLGFNHDLMMTKVWFDKGAVGDIHHHRHTQSTYIESGVFEVYIDGEIRVLSAGDAYYIAPDKEHGVICKEAGVLIDVFNPHREDFLTSNHSENNNEN